MASKSSSYIPRFLLPQYGPLWRSTRTTTTRAFARPPNPDVGRVLVRYASNKAAASRRAPSRANHTKSSAAARAAKASAPTKPPPKTTASRPTDAAAPPQGPSAEKTAAAGVDPSKPLVLERPERFNPPSHGKRLPRSVPRHYGGPVTTEEAQAQRTKQYPGLPPPPNTWSHWFINNRGVHMFITLGTLASLAAYTFATNFKAKSPYADLIPPISELPRHPFQYVGVCVDVLRMHEEHESAITAEKRRRRVEDVAKRNEYRKAHGLEPATGWWGAKAESETTATTPVGGAPEATARPIPAPAVAGVEIVPATAAAAEFTTPDGKRKKFLGIF
ncbi:hypothetical protein DL764_002268 [Monosporascus ibericus]|uniref:Uncharacterized protein n=1 Tax=Monosporascus ibericus TaxID=155417 RepID=A0A4Q4TN15_9PEZI|nr:hypothetical protein DL764_002268 [Monosporascus ibericus]